MMTLMNVAGGDPADGHRVTFVVDARNCIFAYCGPNADLSVINGFGLVRREADHSVWRHNGLELTIERDRADAIEEFMRQTHIDPAG